MSQQPSLEQISKMRIVHRAAGVEEVTIRREEAYRTVPGEGPLTFDRYLPPRAAPDARVPAVVIVPGYPDPGLRRILGCRHKELGSTVSWAEAVAASGMAAIAFENREPTADLRHLLAFLRDRAASLGIDADRIGLWASSGNVPLALSALMEEGAAFRCAALLYGYLLDLEGSTAVADASAKFGFASPGAGKSVADLPAKVPLMLARAGQDAMPGLNESLDRFLAAAVAANLPVSFVNHASGPHAFDLFDDGDASREIIRRVLAFLRFHLVERE